MIYWMNKDNIEEVLEQNIKIEYVGSRKKKYVNIASAFDIETTSFMYNGLKCALMYVWQFGVYNTETKNTIVIMGRTWEEFGQLMNYINNMIKHDEKCEYYFPIYVHNLAFEYSFLSKEFKGLFGDSFFTKENTPIYCRLQGIEFRCSYMLSGCGLQYLDTPTKKSVGDLDYKLLRHYKTPLTKTELGYCANDVIVVCEYIQSKINQDGNVANIPYTKTGYVRRGLRDYCVGNQYFSNQKTEYTNMMKELQINDTREYYVLRFAYSGGFTGANPIYHGQLLNNVLCVDFTSSYPSTICEYEFPIKYMFYMETLDETQYKMLLDKHRAVVCKVRLHNLKAKHPWSTSISYWRCDEIEAEKFDLNNGKLYEANYVDLYITDIDWKIITMNYDFDTPEFTNAYVYQKGYLPKSVVEYILQLYQDKTQLKNVNGKEVHYNLSKEQLNSIYGCCVTDPCKALVEDSDNGFVKEKIDKDKLVDKCSTYNSNIVHGKSAVAYQWGVYISAIARYNLWLGINVSGQLGIFVYSDTDSQYVIHDKELYPEEVEIFDTWIKNYNNFVKYKMEKMCKHYGFKEDCWRPKTVEGVEKPLGYWDDDGFCTRFKTLGAKRYIKEIDNKIKITVAGLGKKQGAEYLVNNFEDPFEAFEDGLEIPKGMTGKMTHTIITDTRKGQITDYLGNTVDFISRGGTHLEECGFKMSTQDNYIRFLTGVKESYEVGI